MSQPLERVLVTGASGFIGSWLCRRLVDSGLNVSGTIRSRPASGSLLDRLGLTQKLQLVDCSSPLSLAGHIETYRPTTIFNLAGQSQVGAAKDDPAGAFRANTQFVWELLDAVRSLERPAAVIHASSDVVAGSAENNSAPSGAIGPYAASKAAAEFVLRSYAATFGIPVAIVRLGNIYGAGDPNQARLIPELTRAFAARRPPKLRDGKSVRTYLHIDDAVDALIHLARHAHESGPNGGEVFTVAGDRPYTNLEVAQLARDASGRSDTGIVVADIAATHAQRGGTDKIETVLAWKPRIDLADGLRQLVSEEAKWQRQSNH